MGKRTREQTARIIIDLTEEGMNIKEISDFLGYKTKNYVRCIVNLFGGKVEDGKVIGLDKDNLVLKKEYNHKSKNQDYIDDVKKTKIITRICPKCKRKYKTKTYYDNVAKKHFAIHNRCLNCKSTERNSNNIKYYDHYSRRVMM